MTTTMMMMMMMMMMMTEIQSTVDMSLSIRNDFKMPFPVAARSKTWVCSRSLPGFVGSYPAGDTDVCLF
jgi:hypothetical protein